MLQVEDENLVLLVSPEENCVICVTFWEGLLVVVSQESPSQLQESHESWDETIWTSKAGMEQAFHMTKEIYCMGIT